MSLISLTCAVFVSKVFRSRGGYGQLCGPIFAYLPKIFTSSAWLARFPFDSKRLEASGDATKHADSATCLAVNDALVTFVDMCRQLAYPVLCLAQYWAGEPGLQLAPTVYGQ
jgi:hypothetical protein